jgi:hypothetical protein
MISDSSRLPVVEAVLDIFARAFIGVGLTMNTIYFYIWGESVKHHLQQLVSRL